LLNLPDTTLLAVLALTVLVVLMENARGRLLQRSTERRLRAQAEKLIFAEQPMPPVAAPTDAQARFFEAAAQREAYLTNVSFVIELTMRPRYNLPVRVFVRHAQSKLMLRTISRHPGRRPSRRGLILTTEQQTATTLAVSVKELAARRKKWRRPKPRYRHGVLAKFAHTCQSASLGAVTDLSLSP
jgi:hypothetical protein